jgi:hypothetical protein
MKSKPTNAHNNITDYNCSMCFVVFVLLNVRVFFFVLCVGVFVRCGYFC